MAKSAKKNGNCYDANAKIVLDKMGTEDEDLYKLCHGVAILTSDGLPFGHCWIEVGNDIVMDFSNGNHFIGRKDDYYKAGKIPVKGWEKIYKYSPVELATKIVKTKNWGPWDYNPPR